MVFGAGLKELSPIMPVSPSSLLQSCAKKLYIFSSGKWQQLEPLFRMMENCMKDIFRYDSFFDNNDQK